MEYSKKFLERLRKELIQEERLRNLIRKSIKTVNRRKILEERQQQKLRSYVIKLVVLYLNF